MKILALDIATHTGWKTQSGSGTWDFTPKKGDSEGMRVVRFKKEVIAKIESESIEMISYERPFSGKFPNSIIAPSKMIGVLEDLCYERGIHLTAYAPKEIKKFATGNGNAGKPLMMQAAVALGYKPKDDNEADAIHLYLLTVKDVGQKQPERRDLFDERLKHDF
jgi:Holliday junction resolvasome RuvABC endonuclease subunit